MYIHRYPAPLTPTWRDRGYRRSSGDINLPLRGKPIIEFVSLLKAARLCEEIGGLSDGLMT
jgi:hypothetical protein